MHNCACRKALGFEGKVPGDTLMSMRQKMVRRGRLT